MRGLNGKPITVSPSSNIRLISGARAAGLSVSRSFKDGHPTEILAKRGNVTVLLRLADGEQTVKAEIHMHLVRTMTLREAAKAIGLNPKDY